MKNFKKLTVAAIAFSALLLGGCASNGMYDPDGRDSAEYRDESRGIYYKGEGAGSVGGSEIIRHKINETRREQVQSNAVSNACKKYPDAPSCKG